MAASGQHGGGSSTASPNARLLDASVPAEPGAVRRARAEVEEAVRPHVSRESLVVLRLMVSEVVTNAVRRGDARATVRILVHLREAVHVDVISTTPPTADEAGYGLFIVTQLAESWGIDNASGRHRVWFTVPRWPNG
jgi:anti-sigma regulatory factor (Ser/Thr protein kinase)